MIKCGITVAKCVQISSGLLLFQDALEPFGLVACYHTKILTGPYSSEYDPRLEKMK